MATLLTQILTFTGAPEEAARVAGDVLAGLPEDRRDIRRRLEAQRYVAIQWGGGRLEEVRDLDAFASGFDEPGPGARMMDAVVALRLAYDVAPVEEVLPLLERAYGDGSLLEADDGLFTVVVLLLHTMADRDEALGIADDMLARAHHRGSQFGLLAVSLWRGWLHLRRGDLVDAADSLQQALDELAAWHGAAGGDVYAAALHAHALLERGDLDGAWRSLDPRMRDHVWTSLEAARWWAGVECELLLASGRPEEVLPIAEQLRTEHWHVRNPTAMSWRSPRARALHALGRTEEALTLAGEALALARSWGAPSAVARALRERGEMRGEDGLEDLAAAVAAVEGTPARLELAKALAAHGRTLRHARRPADAREPLRRALELADACGAEALAEAVRSELYAAGARPRTTALSGAGALTASERRVAALAAEGSSNRDIAQSLFVTPKTVEVHLSNAYRKLGIRSRRELTAALA